ncbi:hypothetical protein [Bizionia arctica]|uniref:Uncharacterized protein n=1 Tax=Bizionia arctica TaxID=1495645 RepID=A0A917LN34_9FLAO|nr:hypothetical protein [Bizionia arctica]GGG46795.1 hypothetical protein GCM10010976_17800 [Bizionia arctica]
MRKIVIASGIFLIVCIGFIFYFLFKPKYRNVSNEKPFSEIVNKKLITKKRALLLNPIDSSKDENYSYHLEDGTSYGMDSGLEIIAEIPIATEVIIDKVELHTGRVSGTTTAYLFGKVYSEDIQGCYNFQYTWGDYHVLYEDKPYWTFPLAFWQNQPLTEKYVIKVP